FGGDDNERTAGRQTELIGHLPQRPVVNHSSVQQRLDRERKPWFISERQAGQLIPKLGHHSRGDNFGETTNACFGGRGVWIGIVVMAGSQCAMVERQRDHAGLRPSAPVAVGPASCSRVGIVSAVRRCTQHCWLFSSCTADAVGTAHLTASRGSYCDRACAHPG